LFMNAMTWFDHETESIWSQPWGRAIKGDLQDTNLELLPSQIMTYENWLDEHPNTLVMVSGLEELRSRKLEVPSPSYVIGVKLGEVIEGFAYKSVENIGGVLNEFVEDVPIVIWVSEGGYHVFARQVETRILSFELGEELGTIVDQETGSTWQLNNGLAIDGELRGKALLRLPTFSSDSVAWNDFYPEAELFRP